MSHRGYQGRRRSRQNQSGLWNQVIKMSEDQLAIIAEVFLVVFGLICALVAGYVMGYRDARKHQEKDRVR